MRLAVLSDIHGNLIALETVLKDLRAIGGADRTWVLGDLCLLGPRPAECVKLIRDLPHSQVISGNTDRELVTGNRPPMRPKDEAEWKQVPERLRGRERLFAWTCAQLTYADYEYLSKLRHGLELDVQGYGWAIGYHGSPGNDEGVLLPDTPDDEVLDHFLDYEGRLGFGGHTHMPMDRDLGAWRVVNVGSIGLPFDEPRSCYALVTFENGTTTVELRRVDYDIDAVVADLKAQGDPYRESTEQWLRNGRR